MAPNENPPRARPVLAYVVTEDWYFLSHRLPMARAAQRAGYEVHVITHVDEDGGGDRGARLRAASRGLAARQRQSVGVSVEYSRRAPRLPRDRPRSRAQCRAAADYRRVAGGEGVALHAAQRARRAWLHLHLGHAEGAPGAADFARAVAPRAAPCACGGAGAKSRRPRRDPKSRCRRRSHFYRSRAPASKPIRSRRCRSRTGH